MSPTKKLRILSENEFEKVLHAVAEDITAINHRVNPILPFHWILFNRSASSSGTALQRTGYI